MYLQTAMLMLFSVILLDSIDNNLLAGPGENKQSDPRTTTQLFPTTDFYPRYLADPRRAQSMVGLSKFGDSDIPAAGDERAIVRFGGRFPLVRFHPENHRELGWQVDLEGGFFGHFDLAQSMDNIGWDGVYGFMVNYKPTAPLALRCGLLHDSAHVGDEFAQNTARRRIGYTREELIAGVGWRMNQRVQSYAELGRAFDTIAPAKPERVQAGVIYYLPGKAFNRRARRYLAVDINSFNERNWRPALTAQFGYILPTDYGASQWRIALELYHGRSVLGEFSFHDENYVALGLFYDQ